MQGMRENEGVSELTSKIQLHGVLSKKQSGPQSTKWMKRFFIVKDGYLLYYQDNEKKDFEKKRCFNIHPKGVFPLGACAVEPVAEVNHPFSIRLNSAGLNVSLTIATESDYERNKWIEALLHSARITFDNAQLADAMVQRLEDHGLQMAKEKQDYFDKLQSEASALHDERLKTEELERVKEELEKEKKKMEKFSSDLKEEYEKLKGEMEVTLSSMQSVEDEKRSLQQSTRHLQVNLESLEAEKQKTIKELRDRELEAQKLSKEKENLSAATETLRDNLRQIENKTASLREEYSDADAKMRVMEERTRLLEMEKMAINEHAQELQASMKELAAQKAVTEAELKEEVMARMDAERRLQEAEESLSRLEKAVKGEGTEGKDQDKVKEEMIGDVRTLKQFFENLAFEAKLDADKPLLIKNSIHARKQMVRRAKTMRFEASRKRKSRASRTSYDTLESIFEDGCRNNKTLQYL